MLAERIGIDTETIKQWTDLKLNYPMGKVFDYWVKDGNSSVRMLHRHLKSPQMRCTLLAKRVADFYEVD